MSAPLIDRLSTKFVLDPVTGCWQWTASLRNGYGQISVGRGADRSVRGAHVVMWELVVGPVPDGHELDHLCRNRACVNPAHLESVDHRTNVLRGECPAAANARKTHCRRGHELTEDNVYRYGRKRHCKPCTLAAAAEWQAARKAA